MIDTERNSAAESSFTQSVRSVNRQAAQHGHDKSTQTRSKPTEKSHRPTSKVATSPVITTSADKVAWNAALLLAIDTVQRQQLDLNERELRRSASRLLVFNPLTGSVTVYNSAQQASDVRRRLTSMTYLQP